MNMCNSITPLTQTTYAMTPCIAHIYTYLYMCFSLNHTAADHVPAESFVSDDAAFSSGWNSMCSSAALQVIVIWVPLVLSTPTSQSTARQALIRMWCTSAMGCMRCSYIRRDRWSLWIAHCCTAHLSTKHWQLSTRYGQWVHRYQETTSVPVSRNHQRTRHLSFSLPVHIPCMSAQCWQCVFLVILSHTPWQQHD